MENTEYIFYIKELATGAIMGVTEIEPDEHRKGWIRSITVNCGIDEDIYIGAERGTSADVVFNSGLYDYAKDLVKLIEP